MPWLLPIHSEPWSTFYQEVLVALLVAFLWLFLLLRDDVAWCLDRVSIFFFIVIGLVVVQAFFGVYVLSEEYILVVSYLLVCVVSISIGYRVAYLDKAWFLSLLYGGFLVAGLLSVFLAVYQWLGLGILGSIVFYEDNFTRASANLAQPNNLATLLGWACISVWWFYGRKGFSGCVSFCLVVFLLLGVALTGSRTGQIQVFVLIFLSWLFNRHCRRAGRSEGVVPSCVLCFVFCLVVFFNVVLVPCLADFFEHDSRSIISYSSVGVRLSFWQMSIVSLLDSPLIGVGWNQSVSVHIRLAEIYNYLPSVMGSAHNVVLDILLWNGPVLGGGGVVLSFFWIARQRKIFFDDTAFFLLALLVVFFIHAFLELPHLYLFFIVPSCMAVGMLTFYSGLGGGVGIPRSLSIVFCLAFIASLWQVFGEYKYIEEDNSAHKRFVARIAGVSYPEPQFIFFLNSLRDAFLVSRIEPVRNMAESDVDSLRRLAHRYPSAGILARYAEALALNGEASESSKALKLICNLRGPDVCASSISAWRARAMLGRWEMNEVVLPESFPRDRLMYR
ncbi:PglL family O-oligosaccharyltransferase [Pseudomonas anguilliseptica]|uniref:PglL family O-oligosaccharyltransferase n=1 Tax=Pseudomonas anguilliseptica TaxID=53406 RepID=UPI0022B01440|nr:O-antigen ligase family protein [Pseudomonas anguilliseptica]MCZ4321115.1 Wzy polymerase domain-containing protein [Pseudomonas anguilliseptica]